MSVLRIPQWSLTSPNVGVLASSSNSPATLFFFSSANNSLARCARDGPALSLRRRLPREEVMPIPFRVSWFVV